MSHFLIRFIPSECNFTLHSPADAGMHEYYMEAQTLWRSQVFLNLEAELTKSPRSLQGYDKEERQDNGRFLYYILFFV